MLSVKKIFILAIFGLTISFDFLAASSVRRGDLSLMRFMTNSQSLSEGNPQRSLSCFDYYVPVLNGITEEYEKSYAACLKSADEQRVAIDENTRPDRDQIEASAADACSALQSCSQNANSIPYFECFVDEGSENTKIMYAISANASDVLVYVREEYRLIDNVQYKCTNASERAYVQNTASTYEELQACLQGKIPVPTTTTPAPETTTAAPETTTAAPETTTAAPETTTPAPETTTAAPETTTAAPETTTAEPEESTPPGPEEEPATAPPGTSASEEEI